MLAIAGFMATFGAGSPAFAADILLKLASFPNGNHLYFHRLLEMSLKAAGHTVHIESTDNLPQPRIVKYIDSGDLTLYWMLQTKERDEKFVAVEHRLTRGLIGQRVMLIPKGDESLYANIKSLEDLKATGKVAGLGLGWFDVLVWKESGLALIEQTGDWRFLYGMVATKARGIDYFPRGAIEIVAEAKDQPGLAIEPNLLLVYPRDFVFYLSKANADLKPILEAALKQAEKSGLQKKLIDEFFGPSIASLGLNKRTKINLATPASN